MPTHRPIRTRSSSPALVLASVGLVALAGCEGGHQEPAPASGAEMAWARAALDRNPNLDVVAADPDAGAFTVRDRSSGEVRVVKVGDLAAVPVAQLSAPTAAAPAAAPVEPAPAAAAMAAEQPYAEEPASDAASPSAGVAATNGAAQPKYTIERSGSGVKVTGPGVAIVSTPDPQAMTSARNEPGQRTVEPIVCEGQHMMHIDSRRIFVNGDAITALSGCQLFITNSRIVASGTGVVVRDSVVHITNSYIEGATGSYDAGIGARLFIQGSTFNGVMHRDAFAQITDQDGNPTP
jgi:hypothetical protein